jgi:RNA polymerase sigma-70 factor, ECF subfamily
MPEHGEPGKPPELGTRDVALYLYEKYRAGVLRLALRYGAGRVGWAEDVTQDVFVSLLVNMPDLSRVEELEGYFYRLTTRRCLNRLRHERVANSAPVRWLLSSLGRTPQTPEMRALVNAQLRQVGEALERLPPKERVAVSMHYIDHKTQQEIAELLGHSKGYVNKLLKRAVRRLRESGVEVGDAR